MAPILSPAAKAEMDKLNREGDNIGSWGTGSARSHDIKFIYEAAEKCRAEGYRQYQNNNLRVAYVMFLRFAKFFDVIKSLPSLQPTSAAHKKCKVDLLNALTLMEQIKPKLLVKYGESPAAAATATAIAPRDEDVADLTKTLESASTSWFRLCANGMVVNAAIGRGWGSVLWSPTPGASPTKAKSCA